VSIAGQEVIGASVKVREIASASTGDEDFLAHALGMFEQRNPSAPLARFDGAHQPGSAPADNEHVGG
jgi:hypothetical protein